MLKTALLTGAAIFVVMPGSASAANCGGTVPCACGDTVVTSTTLRPSDPVVQNVCSGDGLVIGADNIVLDCRGLTLRGSGDDDGIELDDRSRVTIRRCHITGFDDGIDVDDSSRNNFFNNKLFENENDGMNVDYDSDDNSIVQNVFRDNGGDGLDLDDDGPDAAPDRNIIKSNFASGNGRDDGDSGIEDCDDCNGNQYITNVTDDTQDPYGFGDGDGVGLWVTSTDSLIYGNRGSRNEDTGLLVEGTGNKLRVNAFNFNGGNGICAVAGNLNWGGNFGFGNADTDVVFNAAECEEEVQPLAAVAARSAGGGAAAAPVDEDNDD